MHGLGIYRLFSRLYQAHGVLGKLHSEEKFHNMDSQGQHKRATLNATV